MAFTYWARCGGFWLNWLHPLLMDEQPPGGTASAVAAEQSAIVRSAAETGLPGSIRRAALPRSTQAARLFPLGKRSKSEEPKAAALSKTDSRDAVDPPAADRCQRL